MNEDHTLGNSLRSMLMRNKDVVFAGYSIPHPSEPKMNLRVQTVPGTDARDVVVDTMQGMLDMVKLMEDTMAQELARAEAAVGDEMAS